MILLLDAHALLWSLAGDPTLDAGARDAIVRPQNDVLVSAVTIWEIAIKRAPGKLDAPAGLAEALEAMSVAGLPVLPVDGERAGALPRHHRDPFDRMLVAQAQRVGAVLVSRDPLFVRYGIDVLPA